MRRWSLNWGAWLRSRLLWGQKVRLGRIRLRDLTASRIAEVQALESRILLSAIDLNQVAVPSLQSFHEGSQGATPLGTPGPNGYTPAQIKAAYGFNNISFNGTPGDGRNTTIAIIDAYNDPNIAGDLQQFDAQFGLPNPVLTVENETGSTSNLPTANAGWITEIALDVEWAHAIAPAANILLVEANSASFGDLLTAVDTARHTSGVVAVSMSWGGSEFSGETSYDSHFTTPSGHAGVTFVASSGDSGAPVDYPAASPNVLTVGGTSLFLNADNSWKSETGWSGSGGGISAYENQPGYQTGNVTGSTTKRVNPDVSYDSNPSTGFPVYDSYNNGTTNPWGQWGGTSDAAPQWAALIAIADQGLAANGNGSLDGKTQTLPALYAMPQSNFHDITSGTSTGSPNYSAGPGFDLVTGRGSPFADLVAYGLAGITPPVNLAAPQNVTASALSPSAAQITWTASSGAQGYRVFQVSGQQSTLLTTLGSSATSYQANGLTPASSVSFMVEAYTGTVIADSATASVTLPLATPQLTATTASSTAANLSWGAVAQASGYRVYQITTGPVTGAGPVAVQDASFEAPALTTPGSWTSTAPTGWTLSGQGGVFLPKSGSQVASVPDGKQVAWLYHGSLFQDLGVAVAPNATYQLNLSVGTEFDYPAASDNYQVALVAGGASGTVIAQASGTLQAKTSWVPISISGAGAGSGNLGILITTSTGQPLFDNIQVQSSGSQSQQSTLLAALGASATSYQVTGLTPASAASFMLEAYNGSIIADSAIASVTLPLATPQLTASAASLTAANLSWGAIPQASGYRVFQVNGQQLTLLSTLGSNATSYQATGLTSGSTASFMVEAFNGSIVADSNVASVTLALATPQLTASEASPTAANLSWGAIAQASGYRVYQVNGQQNTLLATLDSNTLSYQATGLTPASTVTFMVEAYNGSIVADSATASVTLPLATPQLTASPASSTAANLSWGAIAQASGYRVFQVNGQQNTLLATLDSNTFSYQASGLTPASTVTFMVEAYNGSIVADSATASVTLPLATPQLTASAASPTAANLSWGAIAQASGYRVYQVNGQQNTLLATLDSNTLSYQATGLTPASTVTFMVEAYNGSIVADSATASVTLPLATPQLTASAASPTAANLSWGAIAQANGYRVYQVNGQQNTLLATLDSNTLSYQATGLTPASTVTFMVEAYNGSIVADSATASVTLPLATPQLTASAASPTAANLSWGAAAQATGYRVYQVSNPGPAAGPVTVQDASFETPALTRAGSWTSTAPTGWSLAGQGGVFLPMSGSQVASVPDGKQVAWLYHGSLFQDLGVAVDPNTTYQLNLSVGTEFDYPAASDNYQVALVAGGASGTVIAQASGTLQAKTSWVPISISGAGAGSGNLGILITTSTGQPLFDNIQVQASSAQPPQLTLLATLGAGATSYQASGLTSGATASFMVEAFNGALVADSNTASVSLPNSPSTASALVQDPSFESPALAGAGAWTSGAPAGWALTGQGGVFQPALGTQVASVPDGKQVAWLYNGSLFQDLGIAVDPNRTYQLSLSVGTEFDYSAASDSYQIALVAGGVSGTVIAQANGTLLAKSGFISISISGKGLGSGNLGILITATGGQPLFDNVQVQIS